MAVRSAHDLDGRRAERRSSILILILILTIVVIIIKSALLAKLCRCGCEVNK